MFIKRAAILFQRGGIVEGKDYSEILALGHKFGFNSTYVAGYVDSEDNFIDHYKALEIAKEAGQLPKDFKGKLHPEDLFPAGDSERAID